MSIKIAGRMDAFPEYIFSRLAKVVAETEKTTGRRVLSFGAGSPDIVPSGMYLSELQKYVRESDAHLYPGYRGIPEFDSALIDWYKRRFSVELTRENVLPLLGAKDGLAHIPLALADVGDEVLVPDPGYPGFAGPSLLYGLTVVPYSLRQESGFLPDITELEELVTPRTRYMWLNFPSNPTGAALTLDELRPFVEFAKRHAIIILYDNAYSEITFDGFVAPSILQIPGSEEVALEIGSFSKTYSFAGYRMGWVAGNADIVSALQKVKSQTDSGMSLPLQRLGAFALTHKDDAWHSAMIESYKGRRDTIAAKLKKLGLIFEIPRGSLYLWAKIPDSAANAEDFCMQLLREKQVLLTPGSAYGKNGERYVRASVCVNTDRIDEYL
ncbi:aminotransferase class I/II-fold pyridoxal phosphate-dependent enzyme [Candidatus Kaiserbacteria bacterium]|nr:aminotransferase class I/II-fold pyridoxal phosphate-dependent enzyme [Candidatus Kaiserbacteria bacterium]